MEFCQQDLFQVLQTDQQATILFSSFVFQLLKGLLTTVNQIFLPHGEL